MLGDFILGHGSFWPYSFCGEKNQKFLSLVEFFEVFNRRLPGTHHICGSQVRVGGELRPYNERARTELTAVNIQARVMDLEGQGALVFHKLGP